MAEADPGILQSVINGNHKTIAEAGAFAMAQMFQSMAQLTQESTAAAARRVNMADAAMGSFLNNINEIDPKEALAISKSMNADVAEQLSKVGASIAQLQQVMKGAQTTPPPTTATGV